MEINFNEDDFAEWIRQICGSKLIVNENQYIYTFRNHRSYGNDSKIELTLDKSKLNSIIESLSQFSIVDETIISNDYTFETLVKEESSPSKRLFLYGFSELVSRDPINKITYRLMRPSDEFTLYLISKAASISSVRDLSTSRFNSSSWSSILDKKPCLIELTKEMISGKLSLRIESKEKKSSKEFENFSSAFLFNFTYNTDSALIQQIEFEELLRTSRISRINEFNYKELEPPRRFYIPDLIHHYQLAVASENPMLEYISYYHIAEHFFESMFYDDLIEKVRNKITHVDFSYKRKSDISSLIKDISKSVKLRDESLTFNEQEGLQITLKNFVKIDELKTKIESYKSDLLDYYKLNSVPFSGGAKVDLNSNDIQVTYKHLAARIYQTRNSIVHSKDSDKLKYTPFKDDKSLVKEVPLIRFIAEQIIFSTSKII